MKKNDFIKVLYIFCFIVLCITVLGANYYVTNPSNCPASDGTNFPGQNCAPQKICGAVGTTAQCYTTSTISPPAGSSTTTGTGGTDYSCSDATCGGDFVTDCYATADASAPFCDNNGAFLIDRNATCFNKHVQTTATGGSFVLSSCSATCTTNFFACDGSTTDANGCEIQAGASCGAGTGTVVLNQCFSASAGNCTSASRLDCNNDDSDSNPVTCNGADGCEILIGGSCTVGALSGVYGSSCNGAVGNCIVTKSPFYSGVQNNYSTQSGENFLWGWDYGVGLLLFLRNNVTNKNFTINSSGCIGFPDSTSQCTASTGSSSGGGGINSIISTDNYIVVQNGSTTNVSLNVSTLNQSQFLLVNGSRNMTGNLSFNSGFGLPYQFVLNIPWYSSGSNANFTNVTTTNLNVSNVAVINNLTTNFHCLFTNSTGGCTSYLYSNSTISIWK